MCLVFVSSASEFVLVVIRIHFVSPWYDSLQLTGRKNIKYLSAPLLRWTDCDQRGAGLRHVPGPASRGEGCRQQCGRLGRGKHLALHVGRDSRQSARLLLLQRRRRSRKCEQTWQLLRFECSLLCPVEAYYATVVRQKWLRWAPKKINDDALIKHIAFLTKYREREPSAC